MAKKITYADWLDQEKTQTASLNGTAGSNYASLLQNNEQITNTPEWARRTPTEQARVNAAQARAQERAQAEATAQGYAALAPVSAPVSPYAVPESPYNYGAPKIPDPWTTKALNAVENGIARAEDAARKVGSVVSAAQDSYARYIQAQKEKERRQREIAEGYVFDRTAKKETIKDIKSGNKGGASASDTEATAPASVPTTVAEQKQHETVQNTAAGSPSTGETEPTGYAKYLADHPELAEADRRAEAEYARSLPTYGALAEQMAQAGIHGGYSDYLQGVAYAKMQDAKQQNAEAARAGYAALTGNGGTVMGDTAKELYKNLLSEYGDQIAGITDETQYAQFEDLFRATNKGLYSDADIESALKQAREYRTTQKTIDTATVSQGIADYTTGEGGDNDLLRSLGYDPATFIEPQGEKESDEAYAERYGKAFIAAVNEAYKANRIDKKQHSAILTTAMPISDEDFDTMDWKDKGASIAASIDLAINGDLTDEDYAKVVEKVKEKLQSVGVESIYYDHQGIGRSSNLDIKIRGGTGNYEDIHADQVGGDITAAEKKKLEQYGDLPLAYLVNSDGTPTLYYQNEHGWRQLKTKGGSTSGSPKLGNNWYMAIAFLMMNGNKPTETVTTSKNQTYKFITN